MSGLNASPRYIALALFFLASPQINAAGDSPQLATATARFETVPREYRLDGVVEAINDTTIAAQTQGQIEKIFFDVNNFVGEGDIIVQLRDTEHQSRVAQASADLKSASAQLTQLTEEFERIKGLYKKKNVSESALDKAEADLKTASARMEAAQASLEQAREQLRYTKIVAPYAGIVTERHMEVGEIARPGQPIMSGISLERLRVVVDVPQSLVPSVRQFGEVKVYLPDDKLAEVERITVFPYADSGSNTFTVRVDLVGQIEDLFPGMFVKTSIVTGKRNQLTVPQAAVVFRSEVTGVYVVGDDGSIRFRLIRTGRHLGDELVVLSGLDEGEQVALDPVEAGTLLKNRIEGRKASNQAEPEAGSDG